VLGEHSVEEGEIHRLSVASTATVRRGPTLHDRRSSGVKFAARSDDERLMRSWLAPPDDALDRVRWAFLLANLATCLLAFGALASAQQSPAWLVATGVAGVAVLALCRAAQYRLGRLPASLDLLEGAALLSVARLEALRELGVGLAIEDFGVG